MFSKQSRILKNKIYLIKGGKNMGIIRDGLLSQVKDIKISYQAKDFKDLLKIIKRTEHDLKRRITMKINVNVEIKYMDNVEEFEKLERLL